MNAVVTNTVLSANFTGFTALALDKLALSNTHIQTSRRKRFDKTQLTELTESVRNVGVLQPILARADIELFLPARLNIQLNPSKTVLQPIERGIDFVGQVIQPWRRTIRRRTYREALTRLAGMPAADLYASANSYFGLLRQATHSHADRARLANLLRRRGHCVDGRFTKTYRRKEG